jgi:hypothetical protein
MSMSVQKVSKAIQADKQESNGFRNFWLGPV